MRIRSTSNSRGKGRQGLAENGTAVAPTPNLLSLAIGPLGGGVLGKIAIRARRVAEQSGEACELVRCSDGAIRLIATDHQAQVQSVPGRHRRVEALLHRCEIIAAIADGAAMTDDDKHCVYAIAL